MLFWECISYKIFSGLFKNQNLTNYFYIIIFIGLAAFRGVDAGETVKREVEWGRRPVFPIIILYISLTSLVIVWCLPFLERRGFSRAVWPWWAEWRCGRTVSFSRLSGHRGFESLKHTNNTRHKQTQLNTSQLILKVAATLERLKVNNNENNKSTTSVKEVIKRESKTIII